MITQISTTVETSPYTADVALNKSFDVDGAELAMVDLLLFYYKPSLLDLQSFATDIPSTNLNSLSASGPRFSSRIAKRYFSGAAFLEVY